MIRQCFRRLGARPLASTLLLIGLLTSGFSISGQAGVVGEAGYQKNCSACHMANGEGIPGAFPPLAESGFVAGDTREVLRVIAYGRAGMPAFGDEISQEELADIVIYIREHFNAIPTQLTAEDVKAVKVSSTARMARED